MRTGRAHHILTYSALPKTKKKLIRQIHHEIDNPNPFIKKFHKLMGKNNNYFNLPFLNYYPHRKEGGHNFLDGLYFASKYGQEGFNIWMNHQAQDMVRDLTNKATGSSFAANIIEDILIEANRKRNRVLWG